MDDDVANIIRPALRGGRRMSAYMAMRRMPELLKWYSSTLKKTQDCRGDGAAYTLPYYLANFAPW